MSDVQMAQQAAQEQAAAQPASVPGEAQARGNGQLVSLGAARVANDWANRLARLQPMERNQALNELRAKMPNMANMVVQILSSMGPGQTAAQAAQAMRPLPQLKPPTRKQAVV
jgi:hypothetical protein